MNRRSFIYAGLTGTTVGLAGCVGTFGGNSNAKLGKPEGHDADADLPYPTWGDEMPAVSFRNPFTDQAVDLQEVGQPTFVTFFFTHCQTVCPVLISALRNVQTDAINEGYADEVSFLPVTFDPERDDAERFRTYAEKMNVSLDAGDWRFLRPQTVEEAKEKINGEFGIGFEKTPMKGDGWMYNHLGLILLTNADGYVERAYTGTDPDPNTLREDLTKLRG